MVGGGSARTRRTDPTTCRASRRPRCHARHSLIIVIERLSSRFGRLQQSTKGCAGRHWLTLHVQPGCVHNTSKKSSPAIAGCNNHFCAGQRLLMKASSSLLLPSVTAAFQRILRSSAAVSLSRARTQPSQAPGGPPSEQALGAPASPPQACCERENAQASSPPRPTPGAMCNGDDCSARCVPEASLQSILASNRCGVRRCSDLDAAATEALLQQRRLVPAPCARRWTVL